MRYFIALLFCSACGLNEDLHPLPPCGQECAVDDDGNLVFGAGARAVSCHTGTSVCDYDTDGPPIVTCPDFTLPSPEVCDPNSIDEDCDGEANDLTYQWYDPQNTCPNSGECSYSIMFCGYDGEMHCYYTSPFYGEEVCDDLDNDCDGLVDADDPDLQYGDRFEYSGPPETLNVGECRAGVLTCRRGMEYLFGEVLPTVEVCGNDDDDDCDGFTDEDDSAAIADAFLLPIDFSGSMSGTIEAVITSLCDWSESGTFVSSRFAIQAVAGGISSSPYITNITGFVSAEEACLSLNAFYNENGLPGGSEYVPYGIWGVNNDPELHLDWPENMRRRVIFFTDEPAQGYLNNASIELQMVASDCYYNNYTVGGFVANDLAMWHQMTDSCGGWLEALSSDPDRMMEDLNYRFGTECGIN